MRLDVGDFEDDYERRFQLHLDEKARKAEAKAKGNVTPTQTTAPQARSLTRPGDTALHPGPGAQRQLHVRSSGRVAAALI
ncbi:hypothetical protein [Streptomyces sp. BA2]|uniref:hypothetical protein n=1 Tax=Streptomyces sp. BA2 TaxID=436595 RepID=UPI001327C448|nr:hypothetical protein [Streptomyces sp. BA2]MWA16171.1 hypothetical protein [Streptomyces sp. BA2]